MTDPKRLEYVHKVGDAILAVLKDCNSEKQPTEETVRLTNSFIAALKELEETRNIEIETNPRNNPRKTTWG